MEPAAETRCRPGLPAVLFRKWRPARSAGPVASLSQGVRRLAVLVEPPVAAAELHRVGARERRARLEELAHVPEGTHQAVGLAALGRLALLRGLLDRDRPGAVLSAGRAALVGAALGVVVRHRVLVALLALRLGLLGPAHVAAGDGVYELLPQAHAGGAVVTRLVRAHRLLALDGAALHADDDRPVFLRAGRP